MAQSIFLVTRGDEYEEKTILGAFDDGAIAIKACTFLAQNSSETYSVSHELKLNEAAESLLQGLSMYQVIQENTPDARDARVLAVGVMTKPNHLNETLVQCESQGVPAYYWEGFAKEYKHAVLLANIAITHHLAAGGSP